MTPDTAPPTTRESAAPCPLGHTDYERCFNPFRYCPVEGCGRGLPTEVTWMSTECPTCGERFTSDQPIRVVEHIPNEFGPSEHVFTEARNGT